MRRLLLLSLVLFPIVFINISCKKKSTPTPAAPTVFITWNGTQTALTAATRTYEGSWIQYGTVSTTSNVELDVSFVYGKPTTGGTYTLQSSTLNVSYHDAAGDLWYGIAGTVTVTVNQGTVTTSFSNLTFQNDSQTTANVTSNSGAIVTTN